MLRWKALAEAVGGERVDLDVPMLNLLDRQDKLVGVLQGPPAQLPAVIGQHILDAYPAPPRSAGPDRSRYPRHSSAVFTAKA